MGQVADAAVKALMGAEAALSSGVDALGAMAGAAVGAGLSAVGAAMGSALGALDAVAGPALKGAGGLAGDVLADRRARKEPFKAREVWGPSSLSQR